MIFYPQIYSKVKKEWRCFLPRETMEQAKEQIEVFKEWDRMAGCENKYRILEKEEYANI